MIAYGNRPSTLRAVEESDGGCFVTEFAYATNQTKIALSNYIKSLVPKGKLTF